jgi:hypothetical protein
LNECKILIEFFKIALEKSLLNSGSVQVDLNVSDCSSDTPCDSLDCVFSNFKKRKSFSNLPYLEESMLFELEFLKQLESNNINISYNISLDELE